MADFPQVDTAAAIPFNTTAYIAETRQLTAEQRGCYSVILCMLWQDPEFDLSNHSKMRDILRINSKRWLRIRPAIDDWLSPYVGG